MQVTCPTCFSCYPVEAGLNDRHARIVADAIAKVPGGLGEQVLRYAGLFRRPGALLDWSQAVNIVTRVSRLIGVGEIRRAAARAPAPPGIWREALEQMLARRDGLDLPLTSDGYLKKVVFELASKRAETQKDDAARRRTEGAEVPRDVDAAEQAADEAHFKRLGELLDREGIGVKK